MNNLEKTTGVSKDVWATLIIGAVFSFVAWLIKEIIEAIKDKVQSKKEIKSKKEIWTETRIIETYQELRIVIIEYDTEVGKIIKYVKRFDSRYEDFLEYHDNAVQLISSNIPLLIRKIEEASILVPNIENKFKDIRLFYNGFTIMISEKFSKDYNGENSRLFPEIKNSIFEDNEIKGSIALLNNLFKNYLEDDMQAIEDCYKEHQRLLKQLLDEIKTNMQKYKLD